MDAQEVPHIKVSVTFNGEEVSHYGAHFIDAISFLCRAEEALRRGKHMTQPVDIETTKITKENLNKLLGKTEKVTS